MRRITRPFVPSFQVANQKLVKPAKNGSVRPDFGLVQPGQSGATIIGIDMPNPTVDPSLDLVNSVGCEFIVPNTLPIITTPSQKDTSFGCIFAVSLDRFTEFPLFAGVINTSVAQYTGPPVDGPEVVQMYQAFWGMGYEMEFVLLFLELDPLPIPYLLQPGDLVNLMVSYGVQAPGQITFSISGPAGASSWNIETPAPGLIFTGADAAWTVENWVDSQGNLSVLPNFGTVVYSNCILTASCGADGSGIWDYPDTGNTTPYQEPQFTANVVSSPNGSDVICSYLG